MSQATALRAPRATPAPGRPATRPSPRLRVVSAPAHLRSRAGLVTACAVLLGLGLVALLVLNVSLERGAYELGAQRQLSSRLTDQRQALEEQLAALAAPQALAGRAVALGMVPAPNVAVLRRSDGKLLGIALPASGRPAARPAAAAAATAAPTPKPAAPTAAAAKPAASVAVPPASTATPRATTKPATTKPATAKPATAKPAAAKPAAAKPAAAKPATAKTAAAKPVTAKTAVKPAALPR